MEKKKKKAGDLVASFDAAFRGLIWVLKSERNFRIHAAAGIVVIVGAVFLDLPLAEFLLLVLTVSFVLTCEIINTLIEMITDAFAPSYHVQAKRIKDVGAALVLVSAVTSVMVGYLIVGRRFPVQWRSLFEKIGQSPWYITFIVFLVISTVSIFLKFLLRQGSLLTGGMPSIHSGISFAAWTIISFLTFRQEPLISLIVFILAFWVAQSRVLRRIHRVEEVVIGSAVGVLVATMVMQLLWARWTH